MFLLCSSGIRRTTLILRLKNSYEHVQYDCKNDTLKSGKQLMKTNCYRALVDLRDAYYSEPIDEEY